MCINDFIRPKIIYRKILHYIFFFLEACVKISCQVFDYGKAHLFNHISSDRVRSTLASNLHDKNIIQFLVFALILD